VTTDAEYRVLGERLILAYLTDHKDTFDIAKADIGDCPHCWREVAEHLAATAALSRVGEQLGDTDAAITFTQDCIIYDLDLLAAEETEASTASSIATGADT
jgi:hypothetical protein